MALSVAWLLTQQTDVNAQMQHPARKNGQVFSDNKCSSVTHWELNGADNKTVKSSIIYFIYIVKTTSEQ